MAGYAYVNPLAGLSPYPINLWFGEGGLFYLVCGPVDEEELLCGAGEGGV